MVFADGVEIGRGVVGKNGGEDGDGVREIHAEDEAKGERGEIVLLLSSVRSVRSCVEFWDCVGQ